MPARTSPKRSVRKRRSHPLTAVGILSLAIVVAAFVLSKGMGNPEAKAAPAPVVGAFASVRIPVPLDFVPAGTRLSEVQFEVVSYPRHQVPAGALEDITPYMDSVAAAPLPANLPLFRQNLRKTAGVRNAVIDRIPEGMRAMTIRVDATAAVEGWASAGAIVDVLVAGKDKTSVVAEKVKILSAERSTSPQNIDGGAPSVPSTVTLLTTQEQTLAISTAMNIGKISFALRSTADGGEWRSPNFSAKSIGRGVADVEEVDRVRGFVRFSAQNGEEDRSFALTGDKWVQSDVKPEGFFVAEGG